ncbi:LH1 [Odocoileus adenovirus 1]|uniref:LH1 n=2 Tax=Deer atadenovirus A TaxID=2169706 RepID=A0A515MFR0_9ADEN|nr:LH1 [Odocoileus adenovirus 1]QDM55313.1 LH1 [Deer atadenovirus A]ASU50467.1 LH1 [Odocoileus adenovirus 1]ASU50494.1 LH1 [Odocoileus adenovirus 1]ASU50632.1 LH1 [Odocoileus adenovirus 1]QEM20930.1 LH1 [Deer atadenovirus A]
MELKMDDFQKKDLDCEWFNESDRIKFTYFDWYAVHAYHQVINFGNVSYDVSWLHLPHFYYSNKMWQVVAFTVANEIFGLTHFVDGRGDCFVIKKGACDLKWSVDYLNFLTAFLCMKDSAGNVKPPRWTLK